MTHCFAQRSLDLLDPVKSTEPFGFRDGISQPIIRGSNRFNLGANPIHVVEPGEFVLGYPDIPVECDGSRLLHEGQLFKASVEGVCYGHGRLYVRPSDIEIGVPEAGRLLGTVINIHRTAAGRRAQIALGSTDAVVEAEVGLTMKLTAGDRVGLCFLREGFLPIR